MGVDKEKERIRRSYVGYKKKEEEVKEWGLTGKERIRRTNGGWQRRRRKHDEEEERIRRRNGGWQRRRSDKKKE